MIRYYVVYITQIGGSGGTSQLQANTTMLTVQNLLPIYSYDISIAAYTIGLGPSTLVLSVSLPESGVKSVKFVHISIFISRALYFNCAVMIKCLSYSSPIGSTNQFKWVCSRSHKYLL